MLPTIGRPFSKSGRSATTPRPSRRADRRPASDRGRRASGALFRSGRPFRILTAQSRRPRRQGHNGGPALQPSEAFLVQLPAHPRPPEELRSEEHTSELQSLMRISYAVFCLKKKKNNTNN